MTRSTTGIKSMASITGEKKTCNTCNTCNTFITFSRGQSMFELILAVGVAALIIVVLVSLVSNALQNAAFSKNKTLAARYSQSATEWLRGQRDSNINTFITNATRPVRSWCLTDSSLTDSSWNNNHVCGSSEYISGTFFIRQIDFSNSVVAGKNIYRATVTVKWTDSKGVHNVNSTTNFSDWRQR